MKGWCIRGVVSVDENLDDLEKAYGCEVRWAQGFRVNVDSRLLLLGLRRMLSLKMLEENDLRNSEYVLGCRLGAMDSYESFDDSRKQGKSAPLAFAYALPSIPLACASVYFRLCGQTYTVVGKENIGLRALKQGIALIKAGRADRVIVGCWETPSATARDNNDSNRCRLLLAIVESASNPTEIHGLHSSDKNQEAESDCIKVFARFLQNEGHVVMHGGRDA